MSYDYGDYLLIRKGKVIAVSGNTEFYGEYNNCLEYVDGDVIAKVIQVGQYINIHPAYEGWQGEDNE